MQRSTMDMHHQQSWRLTNAHKRGSREQCDVPIIILILVSFLYEEFALICCFSFWPNISTLVKTLSQKSCGCSFANQSCAAMLASLLGNQLLRRLVTVLNVFPLVNNLSHCRMMDSKLFWNDLITLPWLMGGNNFLLLDHRRLSSFVMKREEGSKMQTQKQLN